MTKTQSENLYQKAQKILVGGVNSPVRAFGAVGGTPLFFQKAKGAYLTDEDGNNFIDYVGSWGPMILGHSHPKVIEAVQGAVKQCLSLGAPCRAEIEMAQALQSHLPSLKKIRMVNSGTEAVMGALRLARGYTGRNKIIKFTGCYHGHGDYLLVKTGSGALTHGVPNSSGVPKEFTRHTLLAPYNDLEAVQKLVAKHGKDLAAIIVEPIAGNMGVMLPKPGFLRGLKKLCRLNGALLIFDEVMTGFRVHPQSAQGHYRVQPDLTVLGKVIGGGLPVAAFGGKASVMACLSPEGSVYQAGTLSGNPVGMAAGIATLKLLKPALYQKLAQKTQRLAEGLRDLAKRFKVPLQVPLTCGMLSVFFSDRPIACLEEIPSEHAKKYRQFFHEMLKHGVYLPPSAFESWFISIQHGENEIAKTLRAAKDSLVNIKND